MPHVIGFAGYSNSGKTTVIAKVARELRSRGHRVAVMKHDAHGHYKEAAGSDSDTFIKAGAETVITVSPDAVHMTQRRNNPILADVIDSVQDADYLIIEGFKTEKHPKIAVFRNKEQRAIIDKLDPRPVAIAADIEVCDADVPVMNLNDAKVIADFIETYFGPFQILKV